MLYVLGKSCQTGALTLLAGLWLAVPCSAQTPQQAAGQAGAKTLGQKTHFTAVKTSLPSALAALRKQYGLNFAVDGSPIAPQKDIDTTGTLGDVLDAVAEVFDYNWTAAQSGVILMNKRFHNQRETPQASLPEIKQVCRNVLSALAAFDPHTDPSKLGDILFDVASHLSAEQLRTLRDGKRISVTDLPAAQYDRARSAMLNACFAQTCRTWESLLPLLDALPNAYLDATYYEGRDDYSLFIGLNGKRFPSPFFSLLSKSSPRPILNNNGLTNNILKFREGGDMPIKFIPTPTRVGISLALLAPICVTHSAPVRAQRVAYQSTLPRLQAKVHLTLGVTTAQQVADALSAQTGLKIEPAAYLRERRLNVEMDDVTCRAALDALAELNQWKWEEIGAGHIVWTRRVPPVPQKMSDVPPALIAALPRDWRTYLYIDIPWQEAMHASGTTSTRFGPTYVHDAMGNRSARLINRQGAALLDTLQPALRKGEQRPYARLTAPQREAVITVMMARALGETTYDLLHNKMTPYQLDFARATIEIRGVGFLVGTHREQQTTRGTEKLFDYFGMEMGGKRTLPESPLSDPLAPLSPP